MIQCLQEKEGALESVCGEMQEKKSHYERRIGELSGRNSDANSKIKLLEVKSTVSVASSPGPFRFFNVARSYFNTLISLIMIHSLH